MISDRIPYQKAVITLSLFVIIFIVGDGHIKNGLTIALIGLELDNPEVLGVVVWLSLAWCLFRFYICGAVNKISWERPHSTRQLAMQWFCSDQGYVEKIFQSVGLPKEKLILSNIKIESDGSFGKLYLIDTALSNTQITAKQAENSTVINLGWIGHLKLLFNGYKRWFATDSFAQLYLPMYLGISALTLGVEKFFGII